MLKKQSREWIVDTIWGKVAMVSWGDPRNPPVLMLHGYLDTAATFIPLLEHLPDLYYYVGFDNPGHGKSDPYPIGPMVTQVTLIEVIHRVVTHMGWDKFMVLGHSMAFINAIFYHNVYPGKITSMVNIDALPAISNYYAIQDEPHFWYYYFYESCYDEYTKNFEDSPLYTREQALKLLMNSRDISREQAEVISVRGLEHIKEDLYRFTRQLMMRKLGQFPVLQDMLKSVITKNPPRMLHLIAFRRSDRIGRAHSADIMEELAKDSRHSIVIVDGAHDVHITNPEALAPYIVEFLSDDELNKYKSKL
ncbi:unnamed protein product [Diatraea saccharalis]|uniref:AB hydrolase-1 domain-containing protein n=1 Tax=Diatraea saccharalis TaxID=40085 RepID=A0A9N9WGD0_9NEOP|nr:unnamed protein product [Diatraea saccharalis]